MAVKIKGSQIIAVAIAAGIGGWVYTGSIVIGGQPSGEGMRSISEREVDRTAQLFKVRYKTVQPEPWQETLVVRGQTKAAAYVQVRAQVSGVLMKRHVEKGDHVAKNQIVCSVDTGARAAMVAKSEALIAKAQADYDANLTLTEKGIVSSIRLKSLKASLDSARASIVEAKLKLERSSIRANASGIVQDPIAEAGEMLDVGAVCVTLVQSDPIKFTGQISERDIDKVKVGAQASVALVSGKLATGTVSYISPSADSATRTFLTEIIIPNSNNEIRAGITARANINLPIIEAYRISPSWMTLSDGGEIGVRTINTSSVVDFNEVKIIAQTKSGFWVQGLESGANIITLGQDYVVADEKVEAIADTQIMPGTN